MRADELRYSMIGHLWNECIERAADALSTHEAWKSGETAYVHATIQLPHGR